MNNTEEQIAAIDAARNPKDSLILDAYAGCGKTSTLVQMSQVMPQVPTLALAFNYAIAQELKAKLPPWIKVLTFNGLGHQAWGKVCQQNLTLDKKKLSRLVTATLKASHTKWPEETWGNVKTLVTSAMQNGIKPTELAATEGLLPDTQDTWEALLGSPPEEVKLARRVLSSMVQESRLGIICYDDQIYMSALWGGMFVRHARVIVDEYQDLSPLNIRMLSKSSHGTIVAAGDRLQAIYQFRGASSDAREKIRELRENWVNLPLTKTFRCPKAVVQRAKLHAIGFCAHQDNPEGQVLDWRTSGHPKKGWNWSGVPPGEITILCRSNAPLLHMAFKLIRQGLGVHMTGKSTGVSLIALAKKILPNDHTRVPEALRLIATWHAGEVAKAETKGEDEHVNSLNDQVECLYAVVDSSGCQTAKDIRLKLEYLFSQENGQVVLSTIHKFKGLECDTVLLLDPWRVPSAKAKHEGGKALAQERNLRYVAETRTRHTLILANLADFIPVS